MQLPASSMSKGIPGCVTPAQDVRGEVFERALERDRDLVERVEICPLGTLCREHGHPELDRQALVARLPPLG